MMSAATPSHREEYATIVLVSEAWKSYDAENA
jgi:hypothetical protein